MWLFRILFALNLLILLVLAYLFSEAIRYPVPGESMGKWLLILGGSVAVLAGAWALKARGRRGAATLLLLVVAIPPILFLLFFILFFGLLAANPGSWQ